MAKPVILIIIDGFGIGDRGKSDAINRARTPNLDKIFKNFPFTLLGASGEDVGLPEHQVGNSEVGHMNIGSGRIVCQDFTRISKSIEDRSFFENSEIKMAIDYAKNNGGRIHIAGLLSDGGVHSHINHFYALLEMLKRHKVRDLAVHVWLDGRDVRVNSGLDYIKFCKKRLNDLNIGKIETVCGRYYSMDRDNRFERTNVAYKAIKMGVGEIFSDAEDFVKKSYENGFSDEFMKPGINKNYKPISEKDSLICFNFRPDRVRQITKYLLGDFDQNTKQEKVGLFLGFTQYDQSIPEARFAYKPEKVKNTLSQCISENSLKQLKVAETEKYAHVTFFLNGRREEPFFLEERILVKSPKVSTYNLKPEMSAYEITEKTIEKIKIEKPDLIVINYANCDMVGHTGVFDATVKAVETVDECIEKIIKTANSLEYAVVITADHGNAEKMIDEKGLPFTSHTSNKVPFSILNFNCKLKSYGKLSDIAPTILEIIGIKKPNEMTGETLIIEKN